MSGDRPWFEDGLDYLTATTPSGFLHATTCDTPARFGERFTGTMERQGLTVTRYTAAEYRAMRRSLNTEQGTSNIGPHSQPTPPVDLPAALTPVTLPEYGAGVVVAVLRDQRAVVVRTRRGEHLARPGDWTLTPEPQTAAAETAPAEPARPSASENVPEHRRAAEMPSLFGGLEPVPPAARPAPIAAFTPRRN